MCVCVTTSCFRTVVFCYCRMVLDSKNSGHNDYGSIQGHSNGIGSGPLNLDHAVDIPDVAHQSCSDDTGLRTVNENVRLTHNMTQSDLYQRQVCTSVYLSVSDQITWVS